MIETFLGQTQAYWLELQRRFQTQLPGHERLIEEIATLRGRLDFYESRIKELNQISQMKI